MTLYPAGRPRLPVRLGILALLLFAIAAFSMAVGAARIPMRTVLEVLSGDGDATERAIVLGLRLPRAALAGLCGGALGLSGAVFQALLRNPLAEPYVLGISGGAAVAAVSVTVFGLAAHIPWMVPVAAFVGSLLAIAIVFRVAIGASQSLDTRVLLLAGVVVSALFNALILLLLTFADAATFRAAIFWMMGSLADARWGTVTLLLGFLLLPTLVLLALARPLNLLAIGEDTALYLGTRVERVKIAAYVLASLLVAATVAVAGMIGFVGLVVPHAVRLLWGSDHRTLLPASMLRAVRSSRSLARTARASRRCSRFCWVRSARTTDPSTSWTARSRSGRGARSPGTSASFHRARKSRSRSRCASSSRWGATRISARCRRNRRPTRVRFRPRWNVPNARTSPRATSQRCRAVSASAPALHAHLRSSPKRSCWMSLQRRSTSITRWRFCISSANSRTAARPLSSSRTTSTSPRASPIA